jgi:anti-anti-sigma factor
MKERPVQTTTTSWQIEVERGPSWLILHAHHDDAGLDDVSALTEIVWSISSAHLIYRVVLELDELETMPSHLIGQLVLLQKRLQTHGGVLRLCGLSDQCQQALKTCRLEDNLKSYPTRQCAVNAFRPVQPR